MSSNEWYTPSKYIEAAREVMGTIDLDPASCELANQVVKATKYYTKEDNGLMHPWYGNVWLNPPFGKTNNQSNQAFFTRKLLRDYFTNSIKQAILLITPKNTAGYFQALWQFPICFTNHNVIFYRPNGKWRDQMFGTCFIYLGPNEQKFIEVFSKFGRIAKAIDTPKPLPVILELPF